jgi:hypothetical protein
MADPKNPKQKLGRVQEEARNRDHERSDPGKVIYRGKSAHYSSRSAWRFHYNLACSTYHRACAGDRRATFAALAHAMGPPKRGLTARILANEVIRLRGLMISLPV